MAGVLLILAGLYLVYYWWYDLVSDTGAKNVAGGGLSAWFQHRADLVAGWLNDRGAGLLALVLGAIAVAAVAVAAGPRRPVARHRTSRAAAGRRRTSRLGRTLMFAELLAHPGVEEVVEPARPLRLHGLPRRLAGGGHRRHRPGRGRARRRVVLRRPPARRPPVAHPVDPDRPGRVARAGRLPRPRGPGDHRARLRARRPVDHAPGRRRQPRAGRPPRRTTCAAACPAYEVVTDLDAIPAELRGLHPRNPVNLVRGRRGAAGAAAAGAGHQPAVLGLGGPRPQPPHPGPGRRAGRHGLLVAGP